jgi:hypothetical protein
MPPITASLASAPIGPADGSFTLRMLLKFILPTSFQTPRQKILLKGELTDILLASQR